MSAEFDYVSNPIGSRDCMLQRAAWKACAALTDGNWIKWSGGECPVDEVIDIEFRDCMLVTGTMARDWDWVHYRNSGDIVAYRRTNQ